MKWTGKPFFGDPQGHAASATEAFRTVSEGKFSEVRSRRVSMEHNFWKRSRAITAHAARKFRMNDSEELARKERRRRLIERLDEKEKLIGPQSPARRGQMSEEELAAEIEKQRTLNAARGGGVSL
jgi:hypothetical protein